MAVHIAGPLGYAADSGKAFKGIDSTLLFATVAVVVVLLLVIYRSPVLWLLPVISAGVALTCVQALIYLLAAHAGPTVNAQSAGILYVLVFGAGTDYALLLTARYREELRSRAGHRLQHLPDDPGPQRNPPPRPQRGALTGLAATSSPSSPPPSSKPGRFHQFCLAAVERPVLAVVKVLGRGSQDQVCWAAWKLRRGPA